MNNIQRSAFSQVEMLVTLSVMAVIAVAIALLHNASAPSYGAASPPNAMLAAQWEIEMALRRIASQTHFCTVLTSPDSTSGGATLEMTSQLDPHHGGITYPIIYSLITAADGSRQLQESDPRYGDSVLVHDVQSLNIRLLNPGDPRIIVIDLTAGKTPHVITRTLQIVPRNL